MEGIKSNENKIKLLLQPKRERYGRREENMSDPRKEEMLNGRQTFKIDF